MENNSQHTTEETELTIPATTTVEESGDWITIKAGCELTGRSKSTVKNWVKSGVIKSHEPEKGSRLISRDSLLAAIGSHPAQNRKTKSGDPVEVSDADAEDESSSDDQHEPTADTPTVAERVAMDYEPIPQTPSEAIPHDASTHDSYCVVPPVVGPEVEKVEIRSISFDESTQLREHLDQDIVDEYAEKMEKMQKFPPVTLFREGNVLFIGDGWHRLRAAQRNHYQHFPAHVYPGGKAAAIRNALAANVTHGLSLTGADKRKKVLVALERYPGVSTNEIASICAVSEYLVRTIRDRFAKNEPDKRIGADGKTYPSRKHQQHRGVSKEKVIVKRTTKMIRKLTIDGLRTLKEVIEKQIECLMNGASEMPSDGEHHEGPTVPLVGALE